MNINLLNEVIFENRYKHVGFTKKKVAIFC